jgi:hypothetical protein
LNLLQVIRTRFKTDCTFQLAITFTIESAILLCYRLVVNNFPVFFPDARKLYPSLRPLRPIVHLQTRFFQPSAAFFHPRELKSTLATEITEHTEVMHPQMNTRPSAEGRNRGVPSCPLHPNRKS